MKQKTLHILLASLSGALILAAAILGALSVPLSYEADAHYFALGAPLPTVSALLALLGGACGILLSILLPKESFRETPFVGNLLFALPAALCSVASAVLLLVYSHESFPLVVAILLLLTAVYLICAEFSHSGVTTSVAPFLGFAAVIGCALFNAYYYFDTSVEMNAPFKVMLQTALLFFMLYFTGEIRFLLERRHPKLYLALAACSVAAALLAALSTLTAAILGFMTRMDYLAGAILALGLALTCILRVLSLVRFAPPALPAESAEAPEEETTGTPDLTEPTQSTEGETE